MKKTLSQIFNVLIFPALFSFPQHADGENLFSSEYRFFLSESDIKGLLVREESGISGEVHTISNDRYFNSPYKTWVNQIQVHLSYGIQIQTDYSQPGLYPFQLSMSDIRFQIGDVITDDEIVKKVSGATIRLRIKGHCEKLSINFSNNTLSGQGQVLVEKKGDERLFHLQALSLGDLSSGWSFADFNCTGPQGYKQEIVKAITGILSNQVEMEKLFRLEVSKQLSTKSDEIETRIMQPHEFQLAPQLKAQLVPEKTQTLSDGSMVVSGKLNFQLSRSKENHPLRSLSFEPTNFYTPSGESALVLPEKFLPSLLSVLYRDGYLSYTDMGQKYRAFRKLMRSRFYQFFLFPELMHFSRKSDFLLHAKATSEPQMQQPWSQDHRVYSSIQTDMDYQMWAPIKGTFSPFVTLFADTQLPFSATVNGHGNIEVDFERPQMRLQSRWSPHYLASKSYVSKRIAKGYMTDKVQDVTEDFIFTYTLSPIPLTPSAQLKAKELSVMPNNLLELKFGY